jgi:hypothetical protein
MDPTIRKRWICTGRRHEHRLLGFSAGALKTSPGRREEIRG